jgi:ankyrin repeat protein
MRPLPWDAKLAAYVHQTDELRLSDGEDPQLALARWYGYRDWSALTELVSAIERRDPGVFPFEQAVEAVIHGDEPALAALLQAHPTLVSARSSRVTSQQQPRHRATLLHYLAANGVENYRQVSPPNAPAIARLLLRAGADPNALASMYGGEYPTLPLLVSSTPPAEAGVQIPLLETLLDFGADLEGSAGGPWASPLRTALAFSFSGAAQALVRRGAKVDCLSVAAGLGRLPEARALLPAADAAERHRALALAAQLGHTEAVRLLLDAGENPDRFNPEGLHSHATPLHHAALAGHLEVARLLLAAGASPTTKDLLWQATPQGWAEHGGHPELARFLREQPSR